MAYKHVVSIIIAVISCECFYVGGCLVWACSVGILNGCQAITQICNLLATFVIYTSAQYAQYLYTQAWVIGTFSQHTQA